MKETTYTFSEGHSEELAGKTFPAWETAAHGLLVVNLRSTGSFARRGVSLTHAPSGIALIHGGQGRNCEELGWIAGALSGLPVRWDEPAESIYQQIAEMDELALRILLLLVRGARMLPKKALDEARLHCAKGAAELGAARLRQLEMARRSEKAVAG